LAEVAALEGVRAWLAERAVVADGPIVLFHLVCERLYELGLVRAG